MVQFHSGVIFSLFFLVFYRMVRTLRRKRVSPWYNILSPSNSRVAILLRPLLTLRKIKHRYSGIFEEVIKSWSPGTSEGALDMSGVSDFYLQDNPACEGDTSLSRYPT